MPNEFHFCHSVISQTGDKRPFNFFLFYPNRAYPFCIPQDIGFPIIVGAQIQRILKTKTKLLTTFKAKLKFECLRMRFSRFVIAFLFVCSSQFRFPERKSQINHMSNDTNHLNLYMLPKIVHNFQRMKENIRKYALDFSVTFRLLFDWLSKYISCGLKHALYFFRCCVLFFFFRFSFFVQIKSKIDWISLLHRRIQHTRRIIKHGLNCKIRSQIRFQWHRERLRLYKYINSNWALLHLNFPFHIRNICVVSLNDKIGNGNGNGKAIFFCGIQ